MFNIVNKYKYLLPVVYSIIGLLLISVLIVFFYAQLKCDSCSLATINPSFFLMPLLAYGSIGLVGLTIGFTRKTASEKNALDFDKSMSELNESFKVIGDIRKTLISHDSKIDRRKAYDYMQSLEGNVKAEKEKAQTAESASPASPEAVVPASYAFMMLSTTGQGSHSFIFYSAMHEASDTTDTATGSATSTGAANAAEANGSAAPAPASPATTKPSYIEVWKAAGKVLNAFEGCANAIRYGIYDEDFIYNVYGSQFIDFYELTYGLMKSRQRELPRAWVNFEWLAVKWTLRRKITGVTSKEWEETSYIIQESLAAIKDHTKVRPNPEKLQKFMDKLERRKFPA